MENRCPIKQWIFNLLNILHDEHAMSLLLKKFGSILVLLGRYHANCVNSIKRKIVIYNEGINCLLTLLLIFLHHMISSLYRGDFMIVWLFSVHKSTPC